MTSESGNLELFEKEFLQDFHKIKITAIADYNKGNDHIIITGNSSGDINSYRREGSKLAQEQLTQVSTNKIDQLIVDDKSGFLYILSEGNLLIRTLPNLDQISKDNDKEPKMFKEIVKIIQNGRPENKNEIMLITKKKN